MKKKNLLMMALSVCMVAVIAVGGTLAYLTANAKALKNTFTFADNMSVTLTESWDKEANQMKDETATWNETTNGYDYENVVVGQDLHKSPVVTVSTDVDAYVFVRVKAGNSVTVKDYETGEGKWLVLNENDNGYKVLYKEVVVTDPVEDDPLGAIFNTVSVSSTATTLDPITIEVAAIQMTGFENASDAYDEADFQTAQG